MLHVCGRVERHRVGTRDAQVTVPAGNHKVTAGRPLGLGVLDVGLVLVDLNTRGGAALP
jgi:hypothetical protein